MLSSIRESVTTIGDECSRVQIEISTIWKCITKGWDYLLFRRYSLIKGELKMNCKQCGKEIPQTNQFKINYNEENIIVCGKHYAQYIKHKHFLDNNKRTCFDRNEYEITESGVWVYTFNRNQEISGKFLIDREDLEKIIIHKWRFWKNTFYTGTYIPIPIHRFLLNPPADKVIYHINGDRNDNRKENLRICSQHQNTMNRGLLNKNKSGIVGVYFDKTRNKWSAEIKFNYVKCFLGRFSEFADAVFIRYYAEQKLFGEFRNIRNDICITSIIEECKNKEQLKNKVDLKLQEKFKI